MSYYILTTNSVLSYVVTIPSLRKFFATDQITNLTAKEIGDGNLNLVFIVSNIENDKHVIVKQAVPYLRCIGKDYPLEKERMLYEIGALQQFSKFANKHIPHIYHADQEMCLVVMQYLGKHLIMRKGMIAATYYPKFADHISTFLATSLFKTSSLYLDSIEKNALISQFNANALRKLTENFVFTFPYMMHETNKVRPTMQKHAENLWADVAFKKSMLQLKYLFINKTDALLHGDLHTGSIMINQHETYVIDPEFAFVGPFGFDIGAVLANLIMSWISHFERSRDEHYQAWIFQTINDFLTQFTHKFLNLWNNHSPDSFVINGFMTNAEFKNYQQHFMLTILRESIGFAGCKIARRQLGVAGVEDIRGISDEAAATRLETMALSIARDFVVNYHHYNQISDILTFIKHYADHYADKVA